MATQTSTVMATVSILSVEQAAEQLRTSPIHIMRLIARGKLRASRAGHDRADWRIEASELSRYLAAGAPDFEAVDLNQDDWFGAVGLVGGNRDQYAGFDHQTVTGQAEGFLADVRRLAYVDLPEALPEGFDVKATPVVPIKASAAVKALAASEPARGFVRFAGEPEPINRFQTRGGIYCAARLRRSVELRLRNSQRRIDLASTQLGRLYSSPEEYRAVVAEAVKAFDDGSVTIAKTFAGAPGESSVTVRFRLPHSELGIRSAMIADLAF